MRIFVDTSVWIAFFRGKGADAGPRLSRLLDEDAVAIAVPTRLELLAGVGKAHAATLRSLLRAVPTYATTKGTWDLIEEWVIKAARQGEHFGIGDLVIAAIADEHECPVWSLDSDFRRLAALGCGRLKP